jgi:predicted nucleic acid-binding protein
VAAESLLVDTDVFVDHLRGARRITDVAPPTSAVSVITRAELFAGAASAHDAIRGLLAPLVEHAVSAAIAEDAGRIRRESGIALPDALIAATALAHGHAVLTRNAQHFAAVRGLRVVDPTG